MEALTPANGAAPARTAPAGKEAAADAFTAIAHGAEQPSKQTVVGDSDGKQASGGGGESHTDRHEKTEKSGKHQTAAAMASSRHPPCRQCSGDCGGQ